MPLRMKVLKSVFCTMKITGIHGILSLENIAKIIVMKFIEQRKKEGKVMLLCLIGVILGI